MRLPVSRWPRRVEIICPKAHFPSFASISETSYASPGIVLLTATFCLAIICHFFQGAISQVFSINRKEADLWHSAT